MNSKHFMFILFYFYFYFNYSLRITIYIKLKLNIVYFLKISNLRFYNLQPEEALCETS
jgi:hypothetical protein